jgi:DNA repair photolyase
MAITGTKEWAPEKNNCIRRCSNNCVYCYAKGNAIRFKQCTKEEWEHEIAKTNARPRKHKGRVMFPTSHDLHYKNIGLWSGHLDALIKLGNDMLIVSKPEWDAMSYIIDKYKDTPYKDKIEFRFTIGTDDEETRKFWEPNAPSMSERIRCLRYAYQCGFKTSVSMEPLLVDDPTAFIKKIEPYVTGEIWIGLMNYITTEWFQPHQMVWFNEQKRINSIENITKVYATTKDNPKIRYKDSIRDLLGLK